MRTFTQFLLAAAVLLQAGLVSGQTIVLDSDHRIDSFTTNVEQKFHKTTWDSTWAEIQYSHASTFSAIPVTIPLGYIGNTPHAVTDTSVVPTGTWFCRIVSHDSAGHYDTSNVKFMEAPVYLKVHVTPSIGGFIKIDTFYGGGDTTIKMYTTIGWDTGFTSIFHFDSARNTAIGTYVIHRDTLTATPWPTHAWVKDSISNGFSTRVVVRSFDVLEPPTGPSVDTTSMTITTSVTVEPNLVVNVHAVSGGMLKVVCTGGGTVDSVSYPLTAVSGPVYFNPVFTGKTPATAYTVVATVHDALGVDAVTSHCMTIPIFSLHMVSVSQSADTLHATFHYTNVPYSTANVTVVFMQGGVIVSSVNYPTLSGVADKTTDYIATDTVETDVFVYGNDDPAYTIIYGDTMAITMEACRIIDFAVSSDTVLVGQHDTLSWSVVNANTVRLTGVPSMLPFTGTHVVTPTAPGIIHDTLTVTGINTVQSVKTIVAISEPLGVEQLGGDLKINVGGVLTLFDMIGNRVYSENVSPGEILGINKVARGIYLEQLTKTDGRTLPAAKAVIY